MKSLTEQQLRQLLEKAWTDGWQSCRAVGIEAGVCEQYKKRQKLWDEKEILFTNLINQV